jgi:hypothetical protein
LTLLKNKHSYIGLLFFLVLTGSYYLLREYYNPGYLKAVLYNDITGRYLHTDMNNGEDLTYYLRLLVQTCFNYWYLLIIPGIVMGAVQKEEPLQRLSILSGLLAVFHFAVISRAQTKNEWYDASIYPFLAIIVGQLLYSLCLLLQQYVPTDALLKKNVLPAAFLALIFTIPYFTIVDKSISPRYPGNWDDESIGFYLKNLYHDKPRQPEAALIWNDNSAEIRWYLKVLQQTNRNVRLADEARLHPGETVMTYGDGARRYLDTTYRSHLLKNSGAVAFLQIDSVMSR